MTSKRGDQSRMGYENSEAADPYGTALDLTSYADSKICCEVTDNNSSTELIERKIGCGDSSGFGTECNVGQREYRVGLTGDLGFSNGFDRILAQFMGTITNNGEQTVAQGDFQHVFEFNATQNARFGTFAYETATDHVVEYLSTYTENINISMDQVEDYIDWSSTLVSSDINVEVGVDVVNDNADLASLTAVDGELILPLCLHEFRIKEVLDTVADTALAGGDIKPITSFELDISSSHSVIREMTGGDCSAPIPEGSREGSLTVGFKEHLGNDEFSYINWKAGTLYACDVTWLGKQIGTGLFKKFTIRLPKLCLIDTPGYNISDPGINPYTAVFSLRDRNVAMPGYLGSGLAMEVELINTRSGDYLA